MKVLVYLNVNHIAPVGGPLGVGYVIHEELLKQNNESIFFINRPVKKPIDKWYKNTLPWKILKYWKRNNEYGRLLDQPNPNAEDISYLNQYDVIHFHDTVDYFRNRKTLENYKGKVLLTSHSPVPRHQEIYNDILEPLEKMIFRRTYARLSEIDDYALSRADYIIFPCPEAEESYRKNWPRYAEIADRKRACYRYVPTGTQAAKISIPMDEIRKKLNITEDNFIVSYAGRHSSVKGYDKLKEIGKLYLDKYSTTYFVICGREAPLKHLNHPRWIEVGWTNTAHSYIAASDVFLLPNKETYFDLVLLEVLSLGKIVIASKTGGNKYFINKKIEGIFFYETIEEAVELIEKVMAMSKDERERRGRSNKEYFDNNLTVSKYISNYLHVLDNL